MQPLVGLSRGTFDARPSACTLFSPNLQASVVLDGHRLHCTHAVGGAANQSDQAAQGTTYCTPPLSLSLFALPTHDVR